jgi:hypothetical protein
MARDEDGPEDRFNPTEPGFSRPAYPSGRIGVRMNRLQAKIPGDDSSPEEALNIE